MTVQEELIILEANLFARDLSYKKEGYVSKEYITRRDFNLPFSNCDMKIPENKCRMS